MASTSLSQTDAPTFIIFYNNLSGTLEIGPVPNLLLPLKEITLNYRLRNGRQELMLWQRLPSFQPRVQDIDLQSSRDRIRSSGSPTSSESSQLSKLISDARQDLSDYGKDIRNLKNVLLQPSRDRIRSPGSPTSSESSQLSKLISNAGQDRSDYEKDIQSLQNALLDLSKKKEELGRYVDHCKAYLSPIRRLPTEIMGEIFLYYQDLHRSARNDRQFREPLTRPLYSSTSPAMTTLVLSSVCKLWHTITLATPQLWSRFSLRISEKCGSLSHLLEIYLSRSKQHPLAFDVAVNGEGPISKNIMRLLSAHSHRWLFASLLRECLGLNMQTDLPLLQSLEMIYAGAESLNAFAGARTLRTVSVVGISRFLHSNLHWDQVHFLRAHRLELDAGLPKYVWELAQKCRALRSLELGFYDYPPHGTAGFTGSIHLSKLESLCLHFVKWYNVCELFSISTLPSLRKLSFSLTNYSGPTPDIAAFSSFISRSKCSISALRLTDLRTSTAQIACGMLHHIPTLTELIVEEAYYDSRYHDPPVMAPLIAALRISPSPVEVDRQAGESKPAIPLLRRLVMEVCADNFPTSQFVDMLESRGMLAEGCLGALNSVKLLLQWGGYAKNLPLPQPLETWPGLEIITSTHR
ncbi:hypothetical protein D9758_009525 [Tetrapyrgos nigripes]|uniref:F-box domain-containing protein n=1 Tax=Tetrapyrgos nigripes TaxID=182062 RepID=A0A8H5G157_9AGAR|nr:hypothetical protein D9758_009525 [Tetrapyrgos nigripes]